MDTKRTAEYWDVQHLTTAHHRKEWSIHPLTAERQWKILGGMDAGQWFSRRYLPTGSARRALSVGVGTANGELNMLASGLVEQYDLYEVSQASLDQARLNARALGVEDRARFICADFNTVTLPDETYDLVTFIASLHHMDRLDETLRAVYRTLVPGGILFASEYVGPDRFDYPPEHTAFAERFYDVIDPALKNPMEPKLRHPSPAEVIANDPTEAVHSSQIIETVRRIFPQVDVTPIYGTLPFIMFWCLNADALYETQQGMDLVQVILDLDVALVDSGKLPTYFAYIVAIKPR
ncbi:MAG: class I SAM-dependent methyltransferase [Thermomicrobiales bacterium]